MLRNPMNVPWKLCEIPQDRHTRKSHRTPELLRPKPWNTRAKTSNDIIEPLNPPQTCSSNIQNPPKIHIPWTLNRQFSGQLASLSFDVTDSEASDDPISWIRDFRVRDIYLCRDIYSHIKTGLLLCCVTVYTYIYIYTRTHTCAQMNTHIHTDMCIYIHD